MNIVLDDVIIAVFGLFLGGFAFAHSVLELANAGSITKEITILSSILGGSAIFTASISLMI